MGTKNGDVKKMEVKNGHKAKPLDSITLSKAIRLMFKDMKSGKTIYLAFPNRSFYVLVFVLAMSIIANMVLVDLLIRAPTMVERTSTPTFVVQFLLSATAIVSGFWLFLKGVNIITDK